ncbi:MAG: branched-chain amino acid ABC transporter permease, partial [Deltaproteobacteria bacterium]|nr:branched-chain amino acid ABC transporter permease [Deltaproteobacteria bacterium]
METFLQQLINGLAWGSIYSLIALGYTMVYGVLQLINFAHGDIYMIGAMAGYYLGHALAPARHSFTGFVLVLAGSMLICGVLGFLIERLAYRPVRNAPRLTALITAIGVSLLLEYGGQLF